MAQSAIIMRGISSCPLRLSVFLALVISSTILSIFTKTVHYLAIPFLAFISYIYLSVSRNLLSPNYPFSSIIDNIIINSLISYIINTFLITVNIIPTITNHYYHVIITTVIVVSITITFITTSIITTVTKIYLIS